MEAKTTIKQMLSGNFINVPDYQRAYSWDTSIDKVNPHYHVNTFLSDLQDYVNSKSSSRYYFGHFLFEHIDKEHYNIIDGQQRLTTIIIFLSNLFNRLKEFRNLTEEEHFNYLSMIKIGSNYRFHTVDYDDQFFKDYVVDRSKKETYGLDTESQRRIANAFIFFRQELATMTEDEVETMINVISDASCTTHIVNNEAEAIQMFIFQNNRGKKPSNLEIIKAKFMYHVHLSGKSEEEKDALLKEIKNRFEHIYKAISCIEHKIDEDSVLTFTLQVYYNDIWKRDSRIIDDDLKRDNKIEFIQKFTLALENSFKRLETFFQKEKEDIVFHSALNMGYHIILMPFVIKAYEYNVSDENFRKLCHALESIILRNRVIGTRASLEHRINDVYKNFDGDVQPIVERIEWMRTKNDWWGYWNNSEFERCLQGAINHDTAKLLLWRYENFLISEGKKGYDAKRYDDIKYPQLEHIAPQTQNPNNGYFKYEDDWREYVDCLGNYLLLSSTHNISIGNKPFETKRATYIQLRQQQEIKDMTENDHYWNKEKINARKKKIIDFLLNTY